MLPKREPSLYYCINLYLERQLQYAPLKDRIADLAYQIHATHTGKLDLFDKYYRPTLDPEFTREEAVELVKNFLKKGSCRPTQELTRT